MSDDHVIEEERDLGPMLIQAIDDKIVLKKRAAELEKALSALCNEVSGTLSLGELAMREAVGHTNVNCLRVRLEEAQSALEAAGASEGRQTEPSPASSPTVEKLIDDRIGHWKIKPGERSSAYRNGGVDALVDLKEQFAFSGRDATPPPSPTPVQGREEAERLIVALKNELETDLACFHIGNVTVKELRAALSPSLPRGK